jgi:coatomer protein complex subunit alpha (xenin)
LYRYTENAVLVNLDADGGSYELHVLPKDAGAARGEATSDSRRGQGTSAVFVARNRFAVLDKGAHQILIKNLRNEVTKKCAPPDASTDAIFYAGTGTLLCRSEDRMVLFDVQQRTAMAELSTPFIKYVVWSNDMSLVAMLSKHAIVIANRKLGHACTVHETIRVKSGAWDDCGVFVYTTLNHIKYALPNGDSGIIRTLDTPVYLTKVGLHV